MGPTSDSEPRPLVPQRSKSEGASPTDKSEPRRSATMVADGSGTVSEATAASSSGFNIAAGSEDSQAGSDGSPPAVQPSSTVIEVLPPPSDTTSPAPLQRVTSAPSRLAPPSPRRTASNPGRLTPGLQVRASLLSRIYRGIGELGGNRRLSLLVTAVLTVAQLVAFVTILALSSGQACDQPLQSYIIVHTVRVTLSWPASFYTALAPRRYFALVLPVECHADCVGCRPSRNDANPSETIRIREARRALGSPAWDSRIRLFQDGMTLLAFTWFILGALCEEFEANASLTQIALCRQLLLLLVAHVPADLARALLDIARVRCSARFLLSDEGRLTVTSDAVFSSSDGCMR